MSQDTETNISDDRKTNKKSHLMQKHTIITIHIMIISNMDFLMLCQIYFA